MEWYWDPKAKQEVCYSKHGEEYMRFNPHTKEYSYPALLKVNSEDEHGHVGDLDTGAGNEGASSGESLEQRLDDDSFE